MSDADKSDTKPRKDWKPLFLAAYEDRGSVKDAAAMAGISRSTAYEHRLKDPEFAASWNAIEHDVVVILEEAALERAKEGSERMIEFLLKANRPQKYRDTLKIDGKLSIASEAELDAEIEEFEREREARGSEPAGESPAQG